MYSIGEFSRINRITPKTLRHYDRIGLLKPATTDEWTGYRYYTAAQLPVIRRILALKDLGFSLEDIRQVISGETEMDRLLERREEELQREYREEDIDVEICEAVTAPCEPSEQVTFKTIKDVQAAACLMHCGPYSRIGESYNELFTWIENNGYTATDHPRESYIDGIWNRDDPEEWLTEIQVPVTARGGNE